MHPDKLAAKVYLHGIAPPVIEGCRVLEVGCATGAPPYFNKQIGSLKAGVDEIY